MDNFKLNLMNIVHKGEPCKIIEEGEIYQNYEVWANKYELNKHRCFKSIKQNDKYKCLIIAPHRDNKIFLLVGIESLTTGLQHIVGLKGIEFI
jgi:hypothetical protein